MSQRTTGGYRGRGRPGPYRKDRPKQWRLNQPGDDGVIELLRDPLSLEMERLGDERPGGDNISPFKPIGGGSHEVLAEGEAGNGPSSEGLPTPKREKKFSNKARLFVGNLPRDMAEAEVKKLFEPFGEVREVFLQKDKNFGFVRMVWCALFRVRSATTA